MAGGVAYDGVESTVGGNIFEGLTFWVAERVPQRNHILELIKNNGGEVVRAEKDAHMLIADHARKFVPPDSISWKYITESVQHGIAQLADRYSISTPARTGGSAPAKLTRSRFTDAEDAALANWVLSRSAGHQGNDIYKEFAEAHPSHPWQSWRNRSVKFLLQRPAAELRKLAVSAAGLAVQSNSKTNLQPSTQPTTPESAGKKPLVASARPQDQHTNPEAQTLQHSMLIPQPVSVQVTAPKAEASGPSTEVREQQLWRPAPSPPQANDVGVETQRNMRDRFYTDLLLFMQETGAKIDLEFKIRGKSLDIWDLCQIVASQNVPFAEVDWMKVAEDLGYGRAQAKEVISELRSYYEGNLVQFFESISSFISNDSEEEEMGSYPDPEAPQGNIASSPPVEASNSKRHHDHQPLAEEVQPPAKRRRLIIPTEIPSTPEKRLRIPSAESPCFQKALQKHQTYCAFSKAAGKSNIPSPIAEEQDEVLEEVLPEAQASATPPPVDTLQSMVDITPSQQLHNEAPDLSPIPLDLGHPCTPDATADVQQQVAQAEQLSKSTSPAKTTSKASRRSLPASFKLDSRRVSVHEADTRAQKPSTPIRVELAEENQNQNIQDCVQHYESLGYTRRVVMESLRRTSMTPGWPATVLMELLQKNEKIPSNMEGVWTDRDDKGLRYADKIHARESMTTARERDKAKRELERLVKKHTQEDVDLRRRFFAAQARDSHSFYPSLLPEV